MVASLLMSNTVVLAMIIVGTGVYVTGALRDAAKQSSIDAASMTAKTLAPTVGELVKNNALSPLRRLLTDMARQNGVAEISVTTPDGQVLAHSEPSRVTLRELQPKWDAVLPDDYGSDEHAASTSTQTVMVPGRGALILTVRANLTPVVGKGTVELWYILGGLAAGGLVVLLLMFVRISRPMRMLGMIAEALRQVGSCGNDLRLLELDERQGSEAQAWNKLLGRVSIVLPAKPVVEENSSAPVESNGSDLEQATNILPIGVIVLDRSGMVRVSNNMGAALLGTTVPEITGRAMSDVLEDEQIATITRQVSEGTGVRKTVEIKRPTPVGEAVLRIQCRPLRKDDVGAALVIIEDVTQQRIADASRNLFIAQATHELRTPLTNMRLSLETILDDEETKFPDVFAPHMNMLQTEVRRLERIISDMLAVSEIEAGSMKLSRGEIQLDRMMQEIEHDHRPHAEKKGLSFKVELPPKLPQVFGDREKLAQSLHNLVGNAIKYTPAPGSISVVLSADEHKLMIAVTDSGMGISKEDQGKLFNRFCRGSDPRVATITGTGLGLALSREIARLHGGDITLESEIDKGSTFTLAVPLGRHGSERGGSSPEPQRKAA